MAGSLLHIVDDKTGKFTMDTIDNTGDAYEALESCFRVIFSLTDGKKEIVNAHCDKMKEPRINTDMVL